MLRFVCFSFVVVVVLLLFVFVVVVVVFGGGVSYHNIPKTKHKYINFLFFQV